MTALQVTRLEVKTFFAHAFDKKIVSILEPENHWDYEIGFEQLPYHRPRCKMSLMRLKKTRKLKYVPRIKQVAKQAMVLRIRQQSLVSIVPKAYKKERALCSFYLILMMLHFCKQLAFRRKIKRQRLFKRLYAKLKKRARKKRLYERIKNNPNLKKRLTLLKQENNPIYHKMTVFEEALRQSQNKLHF